MSTRLGARRRIGLFGLLLTLTATFVAPVAAANLRGQFLGEAWGNRANAQAGDVAVRLGRAAYQPCPCNGTNGNIRSNSVHEVDAGDVYSAAELRSTAMAKKQSGMRAHAQTTSRVINVSALDGYITADAISAIATVDATQTAINVTSAGSSVTNLRIGGASVTVAPGQRINLPGIGYVVFFDVQRTGDGQARRTIQVEMMRIVITRNNSLDLPVGAVITVAHARVGFSRQETGSIVGAAAWGSEATSRSLSVVNEFGRSAPAYLGCFNQGTSSGSNRVESVTHPDLFHAATIVSRVYGKVSSTSAHADANSRLQSVNLLDGVLTADLIRGVASATADGSGGRTSFEGSQFVNLRVLGLSIGDNVPPNTQIGIPGIGTLTLFATEAHSDGDDANAGVYMVILTVDLQNTLGLPVGTEIKLARARADASRP